MIWKFWFVVNFVSSILLAVLGRLIVAIEPPAKMSEVSVVLVLVLTILSIATVGYFYALGWNKKIYSQKLNKVIVILSILSGLTLMARNIHTFSIERLAFDALKFAIASSPFWIALIKYRQRLEGLENTDNPLWKLFALYMLPSSIVFYITVFIINAEYLRTYNGWDIYSILVQIYELTFLIGFAFKKKFFTKLFWKTSGIIYAFALIPSHFLTSQQFKTAMLHNDLWLINVGTILICILFLYALYKYAFGKDSVFQV